MLKCTSVHLPGKSDRNILHYMDKIPNLELAIRLRRAELVFLPAASASKWSIQQEIRELSKQLCDAKRARVGYRQMSLFPEDV